MQKVAQHQHRLFGFFTTRHSQAESCKIMLIHLSSILLLLLQFATQHSRMLLGRQQSVLITAIISDKQSRNKKVSDGAA